MADIISNLDSTTLLPRGLITGGPITTFVKEVAQPLHLGSRIAAAVLVQKYLGIETPLKTDEQANAVLTVFLQFLLDGQRYVDAATLLWPPSLFSGEPRAVKMLWDAIFLNVATMVPGAASMGKSYSLGVWCYLDWRRDPQFTNIQIVGPSEKHLERNLFSHIAKLHRQASIQGPGEVVQLGITLSPVERDNGIFGVIVPIGKRSSGRLQGVKVTPRPVPHPQFGPLSRARVMIEEAENVPVGIWEDVTNILSNTQGLDRFKIFCPFNPKDPNGQCAVRVEPIEGWLSIDIEESEEWISKRGWKVVRLDAYKSENVVKGTEVFYGLQTKEGLEKVIGNAGGVGTPGYYTMARGWFPPTGIDLAVIPQHLVNDIFGELEFVESARPCAAVDVALEGGDQAICALGRFGTAVGYRKPPVNGKEGEFVPFLDQFNKPIRRDAIQLDQLFMLPKGDTVKLAQEIIRVCQGADVRGPLLGVDRTGNGAGVHDMLLRIFHGSVRGINPSTSPTERKIIEEDSILPCDEYSYLLSELWFALRKFIEFGMFKISPKIPSDPLINELTGRRFLLTQKKVKVESKKDYKSRGNRSPDRADACTMLVHVVRFQLQGAPSVTRNMASMIPRKQYEQRIGVTDRHIHLDD
jgi:hypothetical protein